MKTTKRDIGARIRAFRKKLGLTQTQFGQRVGGLGKSAISAYESGDNSPSPETLANIAVACGVSIDELVVGSSPTYKGHDLITNCHQVEWQSTQLTEDEQELLTLFRKLDPREYGGVLRAIEAIIDSSKYPLRHTEDDDAANG